MFLISATVLPMILGEQLDVGLLGGDELVQRGIQEADGHRDGPPCASYMASKSPCCIGSSLARAAFSRCSSGVGADHLADGGDTVSLEEHVLGAAQADALGAELDRLRGVVRVYRRWCGRPDGDTCPPSP